MSATAKQSRTRKGRYQYDGQWERVCKVCGNTLGKHEAEWPHANGDLLQGPECPGFKPAK